MPVFLILNNTAGNTLVHTSLGTVLVHKYQVPAGCQALFQTPVIQGGIPSSDVPGNAVLLDVLVLGSCPRKVRDLYSPAVCDRGVPTPCQPGTLSACLFQSDR